MLESRKISQKLMPDLCTTNNLQSIEQYPTLLRAILEENAYVDKPLIVVLTPGRFNSAYYEHSFLAREMDVPLVTSRDLFVENDRVFVKTIRGRQQVDVIYRRVDDDFLDPLTFRPDSTLGVAGLMSAYLQKNVVIANAPGTGVADDKSIYPYVDQMIQFYLGETAILNNVPTYQCRDQEQLDYVLHNLEKLVVKEAQGSGGYGMLIGPQADQQQIELFRQKIIETIDPFKFEELVAELLIDKGFDILLTPRTGDGGKDIIAAYTFEREPIIMMVECKRRPVDLTLGPIELRALVGQFYYEKTENSKINYAMLVTSAGKFGKTSVIMSEKLKDVSIINFDNLNKWLLNYGSSKNDLWLPETFDKIIQ